jgi:hypothetical protein
MNLGPDIMPPAAKTVNAITVGRTKSAFRLGMPDAR